MPTLCDYADGVKGHYCIGRPIGDSIYWEFWNRGKWCSAGEVYILEGKRLKLRRYSE